MRSTSKSSGVSRTGVPAPCARDRVLDRLLDVEVERVAELVGLVLVRRARGRSPSARPRGGRRGPAAACGTGRRAPCWPMRPDALGRELAAALALLDEPGLLEHLARAPRAARASGRRRRRAGRAPGRGRPRRAGPGWVDVAEQVLEVVDVAELVEQAAPSGRAAAARRRGSSCCWPQPMLRERVAAGSGRARRSASGGPCPRAATRRAPGAARAARASSS